jgi:uncharacterized protein YyaL (SSP411 family)
MAALVLQKLARLTDELRYEEVALRALAPMQALMERHPLGFGQWLVALDSALATPVEVAVIGDPGAPDSQALLAAAREGYHPHRLIAAGAGNVPALLAHRAQVEGRATAYLCRNRVCQAPVVASEVLQARLDSR